MKMPSDEQLDKLEAGARKYGPDDLGEDVFMLISALRTAKRQILAYEEVLSQIALSPHVGGAAGRALARAVLSKEF